MKKLLMLAMLIMAMMMCVRADEAGSAKTNSGAAIVSHLIDAIKTSRLVVKNGDRYEIELYDIVPLEVAKGFHPQSIIYREDQTSKSLFLFSFTAGRDSIYSLKNEEFDAPQSDKVRMCALFLGLIHAAEELQSI